MRVLYIITGLSIGGAETMLLKVLEGLDRKKFDPMVVSLTTLGEVGPRIAELGIPVQALSMSTSWRGPISFLRLVLEIRRLKVDVVHTWLYHADLIGGLAARLAGVTAICWSIRSGNLNPDKTRWSTRAVRRVCALLSHVIPAHIFINSEAAIGIHVGVGYVAGKMEVIPNGFNLSRFKPDHGARLRLRTELGCAADALLVGMIGRFDPLKNHFGFFSAMAILHRHMPHVHLVLAGRGVDRHNQHLMHLIERAGLVDNTHLLGPHDCVPELMAALDVLASPSHAEAFPNVLGEAMSAGVPSVATDVGDCACIIGETGRIVPAGDMVRFAEGVAALLALSPAQRASLGKKARARVASHFEIDSIVRRYEDSYRLLSMKLQ
jgi:glycosyltransferase involved in cell wall biosynthesis